MADEDSVGLSRTAAEAVSVAMKDLKGAMPEASEARRLLLILANAAGSCGLLRVDRRDVLALVEGAYDQGARQPQEQSLFAEGS